jgi:hypothetical protein
MLNSHHRETIKKYFSASRSYNSSWNYTDSCSNCRISHENMIDWLIEFLIMCLTDLGAFKIFSPYNWSPHKFFFNNLKNKLWCACINIQENCYCSFIKLFFIFCFFFLINLILFKFIFYFTSSQYYAVNK